MKSHLGLLAWSLAAAACTTTTPPRDTAAPVATTRASPVEVTAEPQAFCDLVCERAQIVPRPADTPDYHAQATANANAVLEAMHPDLLACYKKRVGVNPNAHGFITVDIVIGPDGRVRFVETTGGAVLGKGTMKCITDRLERGEFAPPRDGGTLRIHVPFSLRRVAPADHTF